MAAHFVAELRDTSSRRSFHFLNVLPLLLAVIGLSACQERAPQNPNTPPPPTPVSTAIGEALSKEQLSGQKGEWQTVYSAQGNAPLWVDGSGKLGADGRTALKLLTGAAVEGLDPSDYDADALAARASALESNSKPAPADAAAFDVRLTDAVLEFMGDMQHGRVSPKEFGYRLPEKPDEHDLPAMLRTAVATHRLAEDVEALTPRVEFYRRLREQLFFYRQLAADTSLVAPPAPRLAVKPGGIYEGVPALQHLLIALGDLPKGTPEADASTTAYDGVVVDGVKQFQRRHGLTDDGVMGKGTVDALRVPLSQRVRQIELSLERLRWLPHIGDGPLITVNIPMYRMWAWSALSQDESPDLQMGVIVGKAIENETPVFIEDMRTVIFRPYWNVPASIVKEEILPALAKDRRYLDRNDMEIVSGQSDDAKPVEVSSSAIDRLESGQLRLRQRPGPRNSLGLVKFVFPNDANVYMHGTPAQQLFDRARRDFSHGCVRVEDPVALAEWVLKDKTLSRDQITEMMNGEASKAMNVTPPVQVVLFYATALVAPGQGHLQFADDIYKSDAALDAALQSKKYQD